MEGGYFFCLKMINRNMKDVLEKDIEPQYTAQKCPVCNGWGTVSFKKKTCHACKGNGYIVILTKIDGEKGYEK